MDILFILLVGIVSFFVLYKIFSKRKTICDSCPNKACKTKDFNCCDLETFPKEEKDGSK
ncbi:hypothetical protein Thena_1794 [Thermodesulfobium narugense DSM 14796]|uniref:FeoB-associated Cys-rich membrane protein n=1 Tax=Thermodesulfobium narugense DSM 14796 TaxID=747365 RepID=M1E976_9BACT|nr:hypothetical protein [Thermodesulfobium narugense]AEE15400.1 hypothetical protein Thena_1794 [Thermodesulfobium narugense DSM 14796]